MRRPGFGGFFLLEPSTNAQMSLLRGQSFTMTTSTGRQCLRIYVLANLRPRFHEDELISICCATRTCATACQRACLHAHKRTNKHRDSPYLKPSTSTLIAMHHLQLSSADPARRTPGGQQRWNDPHGNDFFDCCHCSACSGAASAAAAVIDEIWLEAYARYTAEAGSKMQSFKIYPSQALHHIIQGQMLQEAKSRKKCISAHSIHSCTYSISHDVSLVLDTCTNVNLDATSYTRSTRLNKHL